VRENTITMQTSETDEQGHARVFVPLSREPFLWFEGGNKQWELRKYGRQYTERHVRVGRRIELRHGYRSKRSLWGVITAIIRAGSIRDFFDLVDYRIVIPTAESREDAIHIAEKILRIPEKTEIPVLAFRVELNK